MEEIRILGIAPFESIRAAMERVAREEFPAVRFEAYTGDLEEGVKIAQRLSKENYDVVISRGGTAELLKKETTLPVVEITFSVYDILRAIKMAENYNSLYAIVGFPSITGPAHTLCDLLRFNTDIVTVHSEAEVRSALERLKLGGYSMVICDNVTHSVARELGYSAFLITSGAESLHAAFEHAVDIAKEYRRMRRKIAFLQNAVRQSRGNVLVFNRQKELCYTTEDSVPEKIRDYFVQRIGDLGSGAVRQFLYTDELTYLRVTAQAMTFANEPFYVFCYTQTILSRKSINAGIYLYEHNEVQHLFQDSFLSISGAIRPLEKRLSALAATAQPVLILGEPGTGKQQIAKALYLNSPYNQNPFVVINCTTLNEKGWEFLFNSPSSPLLENHITLYFQDIGKLAYRNLQELLYYSNQISLKTRVFLIFSCIVSPQNVPPPAIQSFFRRDGLRRAVGHPAALPCRRDPVAGQPLSEQPERLPGQADHRPGAQCHGSADPLQLAGQLHRVQGGAERAGGTGVLFLYPERLRDRSAPEGADAPSCGGRPLSGESLLRKNAGTDHLCCHQPDSLRLRRQSDPCRQTAGHQPVYPLAAPELKAPLLEIL